MASSQSPPAGEARAPMEKVSQWSISVRVSGSSPYRFRPGADREKYLEKEN